MIWQEAIRKAAEGGCPLLKVEHESVYLAVFNQGVGHYVIHDKSPNVNQLTAIMVAQAWWYKRVDHFLDGMHASAAINALEARQAEINHV